ncbi:hypothetical protein [Marinoscillum sp.]|uniref:hypothetical protein n=1 Tax=Marinoscillum sp. TaxID=2024838 RepID=UPI003BAC70E8
MITPIEKKGNIITHEDINFKLQQEFQYGALKFANNPLHKKLKGDGQVLDKLIFLPRMLFFVMGFKDLMQLVRFEQPQNNLEESVNTHSDEDSYHWEWYLKDLASMSGQFKNGNSIDLITNVWDDESLAVRKTIYAFSRHMQNMTDPVARMLMVEVLEITFDKFKEAIHPVLKDADLYDRLEYFGKMHQETEENHTTGISEDEISGLIEALPDHLKNDMLLVVRELFDSMYLMAANWAEA